MRARSLSFIGMVSETFDVFGFDDVRVVLSLRPEKRIGTDDLWDTAEGALESALDAARHGVRDRSERGRVLRPEDRFLRLPTPSGASGS